MAELDDNLWRKIESFQFDDPESSLTFSKRLARENGWSHPFALGAIEEYKRFVYLALATGHPVTPSVEVDQVWHLHLTYTQSYWEDFCQNTLGQPFHHNPTKGGREEGEKFDRWYQKTLQSYLEHFGVEPPENYWPPAEIRFSTKSLIYQVSDRSHWVIKKPSRVPSLRTVAFSVVLLGVGGCASLNDAIVQSDYFFPFVFIVIVVVLIYALSKPGGGKGGGNGGGSCASTGCSWFGGCSSGGSSGCGGGGCGGGGCGGCGS